jgi:hypothetical protein
MRLSRDSPLGLRAAETKQSCECRLGVLDKKNAWGHRLKYSLPYHTRGHDALDGLESLR